VSSEVRINDSPRHFMVLDAIARGMQDPNKIAKVLKINKEEVELIVNDLLTQRLIIKRRIRVFLVTKKSRFLLQIQE